MPSSQAEIQSVLDSGIKPLSLDYEQVSQFSTRGTILRTHLTIHSLDLGNLSPEQYRYVARRTSQGQRLFRRHLHKLMEEIPSLLKAQPNIKAFSLPVYGRMLTEATLCSTIFEELTAHPEVSSDNLCIEISADILFEELTSFVDELQRVRDMGVSVALWEVGDPHCPLLRIPEIPCDYIFLDPYLASFLSQEDRHREFKCVCDLFHLSEQVRVMAVELPDASLCEVAERLECDGYSMAPGVAPPSEEDDE